MVAPIKFLSGRQQQQKIGVTGSTEDTKVLEVVGRVGIGTVIFDPIEQFDLNDGNAIFRNSVGIGTTNIFSGGNTNSLTLDGKIVVGNAIGSTNLSNVLSSNVGTGVNAYRAFNLIDTSSVVKIVRASSFTAGPAIELQHWNENIDTQYGYWDLISERGHFSFRDRLDTGNERNRIFISNNGNVLIGSTSGNIGISSDESVGFGTDNILQVNGNVYLGGDVGIGTTNPTAKLDVVGLTELDNLNVSGIATIATFGVTGLTTTTNLKVVGVSTFESNVDINASVDISNNLTVDGLSDLDELNVAGISTFRSNVDINASVDISNNLNVTGVSTFQDDVNFYGSSGIASAIWDNSDSKLNFKDNVKATFGDSDDLQIYHNGNNSLIHNVGVGTLYIDSGSDVIISEDSVTARRAKFIQDGAVELYYDGSKKFETTGVGVSIVNGASETATIYGPSNLIIDPMPIGVGTTSGIVRIKGDLYVDGTQFIVSSSTIELADFVVGIATTVPNDIVLDGAGIGIGTNKTFLYEYNSGTNPSLKSSENLNIASGKVYQIDQTERLSANTLSLGTGTTIHSPASNTLIFGTNGEERARIISDGKIGIGTTTPESLLDINGTLRVAGISTFNGLVDINDGGQANTFKVEDLTNDRVVIAGTGGELEDDGNFTFTGTELTVGSATTGTVIRTDGTVNVSGISTFEDRVIFDSTNSIQIPVGTTTQRDPVGTAVTGQIRYNTTNDTFEGYGPGGYWGSLGGVKDVDGDTFILAEDFPNNDDDRLVFYTSGSSRVAIDSTGKVGIGTTTNLVTDLEIYNSQGSIRFGVGDLPNTNTSTDNGIVFIASTTGSSHSGVTSYRAGLFTEVNGRILSYGINAIQLESERDVNFPGGIFRLDTRKTGSFGDSDAFVIKRQPVGVATTQGELGETNGLVVKLTSGDTYAVPGGGTLLVGTASTLSPTRNEASGLPIEVDSSIKLQVGAAGTQQGAYISGRLGVGTSKPLQRFQVGYANSLGISTDGNVVVITDSGDIGIGTTNPTADLDVVGNVLVSETTTSAEFVGGGSDLRNLSGTHLVSYASAANISHSALSIAGVSTYNEVGILTGTYLTGSDILGFSIDCTPDGRTIVSGAVSDEVPGGNANTGVVYVYDRSGNSFNVVGVLTGTHATNGNDWFGASVAISNDGKTIVVGADDDEYPGNQGASGVAYVFDRVGDTFTEVGILTGTYASNSSDSFGESVAISGDGRTIVVGAEYDEYPGAASGSGVVYVFDRVGNNFNQVGILTGSSAQNASDNFGNRVAIDDSGKVIVVGANFADNPASADGTAYVFERVGNTFNEVGILTGSGAVRGLGSSLDISADGSTIAVGAYDASNSGAINDSFVYIFDRNPDGTYSETAKLDGSHASGNSTFGKSLAISADGNTLAISDDWDSYPGTSNAAGLVYVYKRQGDTFNEIAYLQGTYAVNYNDNFGFSVAVSADGKHIFVGADLDEAPGVGGDSGVVYVFDEVRETYVYSGPTGNIGIGVTNPGSKLDVNGTLNVSGVSTFSSDLDIDASVDISTNLDVHGQTDLDEVNISGITTFTNTQNNTLGDVNTGAVQIDGGLGVNGNVTVGGGLSVTGDSFFVGMVTFASGADGNITIGNSAGDNLVINADIDSHLIPDDDDTYDLGSSTQQWKDLYINGTANIDSLAADTAAIGDLTEDRVVIVGANGELEDSANLTFDGTKLIITDDVDVTESLTAKQVTADYYGEQHKSFVDITVTSANSKTADHRYTGVGDNRSFLFDGDEAPYIQFVPGKTYRFDQAHSSNTNHRLKFYLESDKTTEYTTGVTHNGTPGSLNAYTQIVVTKQTPSVLYYQSQNHDRIGNEVSVVNSFSLLEHNLGIGTVNPLQALQVGTANTLGISTDGNVFVVTSDGNVGIATTNPTADLDVVGLTELDDLNVSGISTLNILGVTGITTTQNFKVVGLSTFNDDIRVSFGDTTSAIGIGTTIFTPIEDRIVDIRGNVNIEGVLIVGGTNVGDEITAIGASLSNIRTGNLLVTGIATFGSDSTIDVKNGIGITGGDVSIGTAGTGFYYDDSAAKVGIGTTAPEYKLDVHGDVHVTGFTTTARLTVGVGTTAYTFPDYDGLEGTFLRTDGDGNVDWYVNTTIRTTFNTTAGAGQTTFTTNYTPGLIDVFLNGVKLSSSDYTATNGLNVYLNAGAYAGDQVEIVKFNNDHVSSRPILDYWRGSESTNEIYNVTDNVGIGTSVPTQLLDVAGDVRIRGGLYDVSNGAGSNQQVPVADGSGGWVWSEPPVIGVSTAGGSITNVQYHSAAGLIDGSSEFVFDYSSNEVGIGTTNPSTKLDVRGGARLGNLSVSSAGVVNAVSGVVTYYGDGSNLTLLDGSNIASGTISSERLAGTYDISITGSIAGTNVDTTDLTVSNSAQFGPAGSGTTFVKIDNAGNLDVSGIATVGTLYLGTSTIGVSSILDEDDMVSNSDTALATQQSIKAYVDTEIDALSLSVKDSQGGSALTVDLSSETLIIEGTSNEIETTLTNIGGGSSDKKIKVGLPNNVTVSNIVTANAGFANTMTYSNTLVGVGSTTDQILLHSSLAANTYRSVEYSIQVTQGSNFHFTKLLALHDGSNAYLTEYGTVFNTSNLATFDVDVAGGAIRLLAIAGAATTANYVVNFTANKV